MIVIPMAGESSRFERAGYEQPKFMLDLHGRPVFDYALASFRKYFESETIVLIMRETGVVRAFVEARMAALGVPNARIVVLREKTAGQAATVALGLTGAELPLNRSLTIFNIDSFRPNYEISPDDSAADGFLETFHAPGDGWSFVVPAEGAGPEGGLVARVVEKDRISDECSNGLYRFASGELFLDAYAREIANPSQVLAEHYVAPLFNQVLARGGTVRFRHLPRGAIYFCGVPAEYEEMKAMETLPEDMLRSVAIETG